jgi:hypothetical protein
MSQSDEWKVSTCGLSAVKYLMAMLKVRLYWPSILENCRWSWFFNLYHGVQQNASIKYDLATHELSKIEGGGNIIQKGSGRCLILCIHHYVFSLRTSKKVRQT